MPDGAIVIPDTAPAPKDYTLAGAQEVALKSVRAVIDGTGAASGFLPTLQLLDQNGHVCWEGAASDIVAAGGSADVSWFPGLGGFGQGGTTNAQWFIARRTSSLSMTAGTTDTIPWSDLHSSDSTLFSLTTNTHANDAVQVSREGVIVLSGWLSPDPLAPNFVVGLLLNSTNGISLATNTPQNLFNSQGLPGSLPAFGPTLVALVIPDTVPYQVFTEYHNDDGVAHNLGTAQMWGLWFPTAALSPF